MVRFISTPDKLFHLCPTLMFGAPGWISLHSLSPSASVFLALYPLDDFALLAVCLSGCLSVSLNKHLHFCRSFSRYTPSWGMWADNRFVKNVWLWLTVVQNLSCVLWCLHQDIWCVCTDADLDPSPFGPRSAPPVLRFCGSGLCKSHLGN